MEFWVVIEKGKHSYGAYCPDLPGCVAASATVDSVVKDMRKALKMHLEMMARGGEVIPVPASDAREHAAALLKRGDLLVRMDVPVKALVVA